MSTMFKLRKQLKNGIRLGEIKTKHGLVKTPFFMPDATRGFVKLLSNYDLDRIKMGPMVVNTFHLFLQPKMEIIKKAGGIHKFMNWNKPLLSDSGGFQVFSLIHRNPMMGKISDEKVIFKSPLDGSTRDLTPEKSIQIQFDLGTDMMVCLDDCPPNDFSRTDIAKAVERTVKWAKRCEIEFEKQIKKRKIKKGDEPLLFAVIQGGPYLDLRKHCAEELIKIGFDGYGFGAMPVDKKGKFSERILKYTAELIPKNALRFALGVGNPEDIAKCAAYGWDMFDCVIPTREGRHGRLFLWKRKSELKISNFKFLISSFYSSINITNSRFSKDFSVINTDSKIYELKTHTKAYLHHLFKSKENLGQRLASLNNLEFYMELTGKLKGGS